jgi:ATP-dependent helicase/nuclease subunit A
MHPIVEAIGPNAEQLPAVIDRGRDIVVTAGAGTGKTRTLVSRYLSLLAGGVPIRSIVAITFTRKAAREMRNRVRGAMHDFIEQGDLSPGEMRLWSDRYSQLDAARIGTIHSLATEILHAHPAEAGVDPRFEVLDEGGAGILLAQAVEEGLSWAADDDQAVLLFTFLGERKLRSIVEGLMAKRLEAQEALADLPDPIWPLWQDYLASGIKNFVDDAGVRSAFSELLALKSDGTLAKAEAAGDALVPHMVQLLLLWEQIQEYRANDDWAGVSTNLYPLRQAMKIKGRKGSWTPSDPKAIIKELQLSYDDSLGDLRDKHFNLGLDQEWGKALPELGRLFNQVSRSYRTLKGYGQKLDYDDLESGALALLQEHPAARERWQEEVNAILVDEFQDTNSRQRDLVNLLAGQPGKLFIVGDAKQSIYRFRGAEVAVFRAERARIDRGPGIAFELSTSYRSHRDLLAGLNSLLKPVLGDAEDPDRPWREPFSSLRHHRKKPVEGISDPFIELHLTVGTKGGGALHRAAEALTGHLVELVNGEGASIKFGDIAILCRASTSFSAYESALDQAGVPYLTVAGRGFYDRPEIRDLLNMLQVVSDPIDDLALTGLLRSPVIGFTDYDLYLLFKSWKEQGKENSLWQLIQEDAEPKMARAVGIIRDLHAQAGRIPVASVLEEFVNRTDYRAALLSSGNPRAARNVTKLLVDAHNSGIVGIREFLTYVQGLRSGPAREGEAPATVGDVVRIMTIHAAKGLEFPVVVIGDINYDRKGSADLLIDPDLGVFPKLTDEDGAGSYMFQLLQERERDQEDAESDRLLYVAATRAQEKLILSGTFKLTQGGKPGWLKGWLKKLSAPLGFSDHEFRHNDDGRRVRKSILKVEECNVGCLIYEPKYAPFSMTFGVQTEAKPFDTWTPNLLKDLTEGLKRPEPPDDEPAHAWYVVGGKRPVRAPGKIVGLLVHEALANWRFPGPGFEKWLKTRISSHGLTGEDQISDALSRVETLLTRFQAHELYTIIPSADRCLTEVPYDYVDKYGHVEHRRIDALYLRNGVWTIVDYKTDEIGSEENLQNFVAEKKYGRQLGRYSEAVTKLLGQRPRAFLCFLDYGGDVYLHQKQSRL